MEYFKNIGKIEFEGQETNNKHAFRFYDKNRVVLGKPMKDHLKFAISYWHTMVSGGEDQFGKAVNQRVWIDEDPMTQAINRVHASFELFEKLGVEYFCFHDVDIAPEGASLKEFFENLDIITDLIKEKMDETGIKLLWNTANLFSDKMFVNGGATTNNPEVYAISAAKVKKSLDISKKLQGSSYVFWGGREGYENLMNTDLDLELNNLANFYRLSLDYAKQINHEPQFLLEPKPKEPTKHQYDFDAATCLEFLRKYNLEDKFKLNLEANHATLAGHTFDHELRVARINNALGSLDANQGDLLLGWDVDEFPTNVLDTTLALYEVVLNGGLDKGGINFDAKVRRTSFEMEDLVLAHIAGMDTYARALLSVEKLIDAKFFENIISERYAGFESDLGQEIIKGELDLEKLSEIALEIKEIKNKSSNIEYYRSRLNDYLV